MSNSSRFVTAVFFKSVWETSEEARQLLFQHSHIEMLPTYKMIPIMRLCTEETSNRVGMYTSPVAAVSDVSLSQLIHMYEHPERELL